MNRGRVCLALLTDAYGGRGGIAQYNRDLTAAIARSPSIDAVEILPRLTPPDPVGALPAMVRQHQPQPNLAGYIIEAWRLAARVRPEVILCGHLFMAPLAALLAWRFKARLIVQMHGVEAWTRPQRLRRLAAERADLILAVSRDTRARVLTWAAIEPERVRVAPNTFAEVFTPGDRSAARAALGLTNEFVILTVGRLDSRERYKGHDTVIGVLKCLNELGPPPIYLIVGEGDDRPRLEACARTHGVSQQVRFLGHVPQETLPDHYRAAQLFVLPSSGEGFGIVLLEAMACGTPAIALACGGAIDALGDGELGAALAKEQLMPGLRRACSERHAGRAEDGDRLAKWVDGRFGHLAFDRRIHALLANLGAD